MDVSNWVRDPVRVRASREVLADGSVVTKTGCKILVPARFEEKNLVIISTNISIVGVYAMVLEGGVYAVSTINAMINIAPSTHRKVKIGTQEYYEFGFNKGSTIYKNTTLVKNDKIVYELYVEFFSGGKVPFYLKYEDLAGIFDTAKKHAGTSVGSHREVTELIVSLMARREEDLSEYYRHAIKNKGELNTDPPKFIALRNVSYAPSNTVDKLGGSYFEVGMVSALNSPSERPERIEKILRK